MTGKQLKNSILQAAVQGKLVPQNAADEPASVLLERIAQEKAKLVEQKQIKKDKNPSRIFRRDGSFFEVVGGKEQCIDEHLPFDIPDSWEWVRLNNIVYNHGQTIPNTAFCYIDIGSINNEQQKLNTEETIIQPKDAPSRARKIVIKGDILYATVRPYLHNMCIIDRDFTHPPIASTGFAVFSCITGYFNKFLFYYLLAPAFDNYANHHENARGQAYPAINDKKLYMGFVPLPPLAEQQRIVAKIEEILPLIEQFDADNSKLEEITTAFPGKMRKSILQEAVQGRLVPQNAADEPASVLLERIAQEKAKLVEQKQIKKDKNPSRIFRRDGSFFEVVAGKEQCIDGDLPFDIPESWEWVRLQSILESINGDRGKNYPSKDKLSKTGEIPFISAVNIDGYTVRTDDLLFLTKEQFDKLGSGKLKKNDIVVCIRGSLGKCCIYPYENGAIASSLVILRNHFNTLNDFIMTFIHSPLFFEEISQYDNGTAQPNLAARDLQKFLFPLPPLAEQQRIVTKIEEIFATLPAPCQQTD